MLTLLKDIFWQDQYPSEAEQSAGGKGTPSPKLDRDRYFMGLSLLSTFYFVGMYGGQYLYPSYDSDFMDRNYQVIDLILTLFSPHLYFDPLALILCILLGARAFGRWLAFPVGLVSFCNLSVISLAPNLKEMDLTHPHIHALLLAYLILLLIWLIFQLLMLARPSLKHIQPDHPLIRLNPLLPANKQYTAVQYMWRFMFLGVALVISSVLLSLALYILGRYLDMTLVYGAILVVGVGGLGFSLMIMVKRLRNLGKKPLRWIAALIGLPLAYNGLQAFLYHENYFDLLPLFFALFVSVGFMRFGLLIAQVMMLSASYRVATTPTAKTPVQDQSITATEQSKSLLDELTETEDKGKV